MFARTRRPFPMQFGASIYKGSTENFDKSAAILPDGSPGVTRTETLAYDELDGAGDVSLDLGALRVRSELAAHRIVYKPGKRMMAFGAPSANTTALGGYLLLAYKLPWYGVEPLLEGELMRYPTLVTGEAVLVPGGGFNIYLNSARG
ncbi:MAG TPA: hypothetical protein VHM19_13565 [Polyangiales bacterium]|nr:hypothetical protein [Polyangiales bacterium]